MNLSLEALLVFIGVMSFWILVFKIWIPGLYPLRHALIESKLKSDCERLVSIIDTMTTYKKGSSKMDITPFFKDLVERKIFFCQEKPGREIFIVKKGKEDIVVSCKTHVARRVSILLDRRLYTCQEVLENQNPEIGMFDVKLG
jgi:hypothetical protein